MGMGWQNTSLTKGFICKDIVKPGFDKILLAKNWENKLFRDTNGYWLLERGEKATWSKVSRREALDMVKELNGNIRGIEY
mgnify:CR=1 FL=1